MAGELSGTDVFNVATRVMAGRFEWGVRDCFTAASDVFAELHGLDFMADFRRSYASEFGSLRIIARHGSLMGVARECALRLRLIETPARTGAIGVSRPEDACGGPALMICVTPDAWIGKSAQGVVVVPSAQIAWAAS